MSSINGFRFRRIAWVAAAVCGVLAFAPPPADAAPAWHPEPPPYEVQVVVDGVPLQEYQHAGTTWVEGLKGRRYALRLINRTGRRVEVVATVDGLDVLDGKPGDTRKRGYVLEPWQTYDVEGFRLDLGRVAAFRFSGVADSYAGRTGHARNVGVIGVAFFEERRPRPPRAPVPVAPEREWSEDGAPGLRRQWGDGDTRARAEASAEAPSGYAGLGKASPGRALGGAAPGSAPTASASAADALESTGRAGARVDRPGLGTAFGESRRSAVSRTTFVRARPGKPSRVIVLKYDDRDGLRAQGVITDPPHPSDTWLRATADPFPAAPRPGPFARPPAGWRD